MKTPSWSVLEVITDCALVFRWSQRAGPGPMFDGPGWSGLGWAQSFCQPKAVDVLIYAISLKEYACNYK